MLTAIEQHPVQQLIWITQHETSDGTRVAGNASDPRENGMRAYGASVFSDYSDGLPYPFLLQSMSLRGGGYCITYGEDTLGLIDPI